ncbi:MAG: hypothetical protein V1894_07370, partial [Chloroflexota bacterium]
EDLSIHAIDITQISSVNFLLLIGFVLGILQHGLILRGFGLLPIRDDIYSPIVSITNILFTVGLLVVSSKIGLLSNVYTAAIFVSYIDGTAIIAMLILFFPLLQKWLTFMEKPMARVAILLFVLSKVIQLFSS